MTANPRTAPSSLLHIVLSVALALALPMAGAATKPKPVTKKPAPVMLPEATPEQLEAAQLVYTGHYDCELNQSVAIRSDDKHAGYVILTHGRLEYLMKPVLSSTGAVRLEDVKGETLMVQIANKSMLLNVKTGHRLVDDCVSPKQRELMQVAAQAKAAEAAASAAAQAASAAATAASAAATAASAAATAASAASAAASVAR